MAKMNLKVSVIIPVYNEEKDIAECISSLQQQTYKDLEIIIVDDGSTDHTIQIVKNLKLKLIPGEHKGPGFSRNLGARQAKGSILIFVDADMTFEKNYIEKLIEPILEDKEGKIVGTTHEQEIVKNISNVWSRCWGKIRVSKEESKDVKIFRAIRREVFLSKGGFDPKYGYADDQTLWFKYKIKPIAAEGTVCYHRNPETLKAVYKQSRWIGASQDSKWIKIPLINLILLLVLYIISPASILFLSLKKCHNNKDWILHYMLAFIAARYFGTLAGILKLIAFKDNTR